MRTKSDEKYVLDLIAEILGEDYAWQKRFDTLTGDEGKNGIRMKLPVDAFFPKSKIIIEYWEKQHTQSVSIMDDRMTVSGVKRGEQRRIYDERKHKWAIENGMKLIVVSFNCLGIQRNGKLLRDRANDLCALKQLLAGYAITQDALYR